MFSPLDHDAVLSALGDKFLNGLSGSVVGARSDLAAMRTWNASWFPTMHWRCLANLIHDRLWNRLVVALEQDPAIFFLEHGATQEIQVGLNFRLRVKRHHDGDKISTAATQTALAFYLQDPAPALEGMEQFTLAAGYLWDEELRSIEAPVISFRDGKDNPIWVVELDEPTAQATPITWTPVVNPTLPKINLNNIKDEGRGQVQE